MSDRGRLPLAILVVLALIVVDAAIIWGVLRAQTVESPAQSLEATALPSSSTPATTPPNPEPSSIDLDRRVLTMVDASVGWRAEQGNCSGSAPAELEVTTDGGESWSAVELPRPSTELLEILADETAPARVTVISSDASCIAAFDRSFSLGSQWQVDGDAPAFASFVTGSGRVVVDAVASLPPCEAPLDVVVSGDEAVLRCADGVFAAQLGQPWTQAQQLGILAVTEGAVGFVVARTPESVGAECAGVILQRASVDLTDLGAATCVPLDRLEPGIAISVVGDVAWVWAADMVSSVALPA